MKILRIFLLPSTDVKIQFGDKAMDLHIGKPFFITLACLFQSLLSLGLINGFSVMYAELISVFSTSRLISAFIQGIFNFVALGAGLLWTWPIRHLGLGLSMSCGAVLSCVGFAASSLARNSETIIFSTGLVSGIGLSIGYMAPFAVVGSLYKIDAGLPIALLTVAGCLGHMVLSQVYGVLLNYYHWSGAFIILAGIALQGLPCGLFIHCSKEILMNGEESEVKVKIHKKLYKDPVIWLYLTIIVFIETTATFEIWFLVDQMTSRGYTKNFATSLLSVLGFANLVGRIIGIMVKMRKHSFPAVYYMFYVCPILAVGHALFILLQTLHNWMYAACTVYGVAFGLINVFLPVIMYDLVDNDMFQQAVSQQNLALGTGTLISNFVGGSLRDSYGEYDIAYELGIVVSVLVTFGFIIIVYVLRKRDKERRCFITYNSQCA